jgi:OOP family OmpA-OmpF porin
MKNFVKSKLSKLSEKWTPELRLPQILVVVATQLALIGTVASQPSQWSSRTSQITALAESYNLAPAVAAGQSRLVFYRPTSQATTGAVSVLVNEQYHASLVSGGYTYICLTPGNAELGVRYMDVDRRPNKDGLDAISALQMQSGQTHYLRINESPVGRLFLQPVQAATAQQELAGTRMQIHTISRVIGSQACRTMDVQQAGGSTQTQIIQLAGDTLFAFNRSDRAGLTQEGTFAIDKMVQQIQREFSKVDRVHVVGHADPLGSEPANERLSIDRALTVREQMVSSAQLLVPITTEGRGSRELVIRHCSRVTTPESVSCNQLNRRVTVIVAGQKRI